MRSVYIPGIFAMLALAGCNSGTAPTEQSAVAPVLKDLTAEETVKALAGAGLGISNISVVTAENDSNNMLGRPGQYTGKAFFYDARHPKTPDGGDENENTVEVFASANEAKARSDYIKSVTEGSPFLLQYHVLRGKVLVRLAKSLTPAEAKEYEQALDKLVPAT